MNRLPKFLAIVACVCLGDGHSRAQFTFLGPIPYRSAADSPFNLSGLGTTFFLEDFEDFEANAPGLSTYLGTGISNSVDADDGHIDGFGLMGVSAHTLRIVDTGTTSIGISQLDFDKNVLGFLPTAVGMVITSARERFPGALHTWLIVRDSEGQVLTEIDTTAIQSTGHDASDDFFIGIASSVGIAGLDFGVNVLTVPFPGGSPTVWFDHIQYGLLVPEPNSIVILCVLCFLATSRTRTIRS